MGRFIWYTLLIVLVSSCVSKSKLRSVDLIIYTEFFNPQETYDSLTNDFMESGLVDSVKIIGMPIELPTLDIQIDTMAVRRYEISFDTLNNCIENIKNNGVKVSNGLLNHPLVNESGQRIPLSAVSKVYYQLEYYKPQIFMPEPVVFYYKNAHAVKVELYSIKKHEKNLIELIMNRVPDYSGNFISGQWEFEVLK